MKTDFSSFYRGRGDVVIATIITLAIIALFALLTTWVIQMHEQELQNKNTYARCKTAGGEMGYSKCYKNGKEV